MADYSTQPQLQIDPTLTSRLNAAKEAVWFRIGILQSTMNDRDRALDAFERVLAVNPSNVRAMTQAGAVLAKKECYPQAVSYLQRAISADGSCGEAWAVLAHCYVMTDDLQKAYQAYQNALSHLPNPRDPNLWYGIGLLYDRYGSLDHALEAFLLVLSIAPEFERADEVCFCIGIIYKEQQNFDEALRFFNKVVVAANPPPPLTRADGWYQIGHVSELKRDIPAAFEMYRQALNENPKHPKTLQNLGWLEHQHNSNSNEAIRLLKLSADFDSTDGQTWYLLGRVYMALREFRQAYDAYQQAVYRDGRNATFWCSIGVLYYQMNQYPDAMDAYSRAIKLNPYVSEVWYDLGTLYESCSQNEDAVEAYRRAAELAPENSQITARLAVLETSMSPTAIQQQQQQQGQHQSQQPSASQPTQPGPPQPLTPSQPQQMHPDMPHNQPHVISQLNPIAGNARSLDQPLQFSQPTSVQKPIHSPPQPPAQLSHHHQMPSQPLSTAQPRQQQPASPNANPSAIGSTPLEIVPLSSLRQSSISDANNPGPNSSFHQRDGRPSLPPAPLPSLPMPQPNNNSSPTHLSPIASQPLPNSSTGLQPNHATSNRDSLNVVTPQQPSSIPPHISSAHPSISHDGSLRQHSQATLKDQQRSNTHQHPEDTQLSSPKVPQRPIPAQHKGQSFNDQEDVQGQSQRSSGYEQNGDNRNQPQQTQSGRPSLSSPGQRSHHSLPTQSANSLPQLRALPQIQEIPDGQSDKTDRHRSAVTTLSEDRERNSSRNENGSGAQYGHNEPSRRSVYDAPDQRDSSSLHKISRPDVNGGHQGDSSARDGFANPHNGHVLGQPSQRERIPSIRDAVDDNGHPGPTVSRQMGILEVTHSEPHDENRRHNPVSRNDSVRDREDSVKKDQDVRDSQQQNGRPDGMKSDRLPGLSSLSASMDMNSSRNGHADGDRSSGLPLVSTPALALPSSGALPSLNISDNGKLTTSSPRRTSSPGATTGMGVAGASLPPLSGRNPSSLSRMGPDGKDMGVSGGLSPGIGLVTSSLTKFGSKGIGRAPSTPNVSSAGLPSSLPSPLPTRKGTVGASITHAGRSPRLSKPSVAPSFKALTVPVSGASYGQRDTVPSPGSLPVLPALSPRRNYEDEENSKEKRPDQEGDREAERRIQVRSSFDEKGEKESGDGSGHGRVADDVLDNKPVFGVLRPEPSSGNENDVERSENEEKVKSPTSSGRGNPDGAMSNKRENISKDELGRTPKRPRLHDVGEKDMKYDNREEGEKGKDNVQRKDELGVKGSNGLSKTDVGIPFHDLKAERRSSGGSPDEGVSKHHRRDSGARSDGEIGKSSLPNQMIDLPRLSNQPMPKLSGPPMSGNTPLPSFRSERKMITATRSGGPGSLGKSINGEGASRGSLTFALRSAPVSSIGPMKSLSGGGSGRSNGDHDDYDSSPRMGETSSKRVNDDKTDSSLGRGSGRDKE